MSRAQRNISITLILVTSCFVICTILNQLVVLFDSTNVLVVNWNGPLYNVATLLNSSSCAVYPYICFHRHTEFKRGLRALFRLEKSGEVERSADSEATGRTSLRHGRPSNTHC